MQANISNIIRLKVFVVVQAYTVVYWFVTQCSLVCGTRRFGGTYCRLSNDGLSVDDFTTSI
jgi:hypothetical protein